MRHSVVLPIVLSGFGALFACGGSDGGGQITDEDSGAAPNLSAPREDGGAGVSDATVGGGQVDASSDFDASSNLDASLGTDASGSIKVKWARACWEVQNGKRYQAIHFDLAAPAPVTLEATLFFTTTCDASKGTQTNNDVATIGSGSYAYWFTNHPDETATSATWSMGDKTTGCVDYEHAPNCH